jgi:hypothetical protein
VDTAQRRVEMGRAALRLGRRQARGDHHQRLQEQGDACRCKTEPSLNIIQIRECAQQ